MIALRLNLVLCSGKSARAQRTYVICHIDWTYNRLALAEQFPTKAPYRKWRYHRKPLAISIDDPSRRIHYNHERTHQRKMGCGCGRTLMETFVDGKKIWQEKLIG